MTAAVGLGIALILGVGALALHRALRRSRARLRAALRERRRVACALRRLRLEAVHAQEARRRAHARLN